MPDVSNFNLSTTVDPTVPYIYNFNQTNQVSSILNNCNGSISDVGITGGTPPYTIYWEGPSAFTANTLTLDDLCAGIYSATTSDSVGTSTPEYIEIMNLSAGTFSASTINESCLYNISNYCKIRVHSFNHNQDKFTYILYKNGNLLDTYQSTTGNEIHDFINLEPGNYALTLYDGVSIDYSSIIPSNPACLEGYTLDSNNYGQVINTYTGLSAVHILQDFRKSNLQNDFTIAFGNGIGPQPNFTPIPATASIYFETGLKPDGTVESDNPYVWYYTGETIDRKTDNNSDWYLGERDMPMLDGQQTGPPGLGGAGDVGKFYFNTTINKFVVRMHETSTVADSWCTVLATTNRGDTYFPVANDRLSGSTYYTTATASPTFEVGYTVTGTTLDCIKWGGLMPLGNPMFKLGGNIGANILTYSPCSYLNYTHQLSLGSSANDDDTIGIVLTSFVDNLGIYGAIGTPQVLSLNFNNTSTPSNVSIGLNALGNSAFSFMDANREVVNCGNDTITGCMTVGGAGEISGWSATVLSRPIAYSPFAGTDYRNQGTTFIRINREGPLGEHFRIQMTDLSLSTNVGTSLPFNSDYEINFNLLDKNTWVGETLSAKDYDWIEPTALHAFLGSQQIGYHQGSQPDTYFYNIGFTGTQSNYISTTSKFGGSQTQLFPLYNKDLDGVQMSQNKELEFYSSIGGGAEVGKPTVPKIQPKPTLLMQTTEIPLLTFSAGSKINVPTSDYVIYKDKDYVAQPESVDSQLQNPCLEFTFTWDKNVTGIIDGNMVPYYSVHAYSPENKRFISKPLNLRVFDNDRNVKYIMNKSNQVIGEGLEATDCLDFIPPVSNCEFLVKPNYIFKNKLDNLETNSCQVIPPLTGETTGYTPSERWYDTFENNPDIVFKGGKDSTGSFAWDQDGKEIPRQYGLYDPETDFYFITTPQVGKPDLKTADITYGTPNECGKLSTQQHIVVSGYTTGTTATPLLIEGIPYTIVLNFPAGGTPQVTLNGLTLFASQQEDFSDGGDYYFNGTQLLTFRLGMIEPEDLINIIYVPGTYARSYYFDNYVVPSTIPNISGGTSGATSVGTNTLYTNGYYYYFRMSYEPIGDIGLVLNGVILTPNSDYKLISRDTVQFTGILYPSGLQENDVISQFYFTRITLQGTSGVKNPEVVVNIESVYGYVDSLLLVVRNTEGTIIYTETQKCELTHYGDLQKIFTITVPEPGNYTYNVVRTVEYVLINGDEVSNSDTSATYKFNIPAAIFYDSTGYN